MAVFSKFQSSHSSESITGKRKYTNTWEAIHIQQNTTDHYQKKTSEFNIKSELLNKTNRKKCCCNQCLSTLVVGHGLDLVTRSVQKARESVYYSNQIVAHTELRSVLEKGFNPDDGSVQTNFFHLGVLGDPPSTPVGIKVCYMNP